MFCRCLTDRNCICWEQTEKEYRERARLTGLRRVEELEDEDSEEDSEEDDEHGGGGTLAMGGDG